MKTSEFLIRFAKLDDLPEMQQMFVDTVSAICAEDYTPEQIEVWTSSIENIQRWTDRLTSQYFIVAWLGNRIVGYASLENNDYLDLLYVHKDFQRQGIGGKLYSEIEKEAIKLKAETLNSDVSKTAKHFFEHKGFRMVTPQTSMIRGIEILNYRMTKKLQNPSPH